MTRIRACTYSRAACSLRLLAAFCVCLAMAGCSANISHNQGGNNQGGGNQGGNGSSAPTVTISAAPASISPGSSSVLTVTATNSTQVTVTGSDGSKYSMTSASGGTQSVRPASTTTYTATATGPGGTATSNVTVTVTAVPAPTVTITANPASISAGGSSILTVSANNATQITITGSDGSNYAMQSDSGGTQSVSPAATTTYKATATGPGGTASSTVTVTVTPLPAPSVTIAANPASITDGSSSVLTVNAYNSTQVTITGSDGSSYTMVSSSGGTQTVSPTSSTTYKATATGPGGAASSSVTVQVIPNPPPSVSISASPATIVAGHSSTLTVQASNATQVTVSGSDGSSYNLQATGGTQQVSPASTTIYTAVATGNGGTAKGQATVTVNPAAGIQAIDHVVFMLQENHTFDNYFGMLNIYRQANHWNIGDDGNTYNVDGIDDKLNSITNNDDEGTAFKLFKLKSTCVDDMTSAWLESYGDVNRYDFSTARGINMDGFVHTAEGFAKDCQTSGSCSGSYTDTTGERAMGYYDDTFLNYYYYMASQFALSDRWFSPVSSKSVDNRIATFTGGTTQGLTKDPGSDDKLGQLNINNIFEELDQANVSWKIYYTVTEGFCTSESNCSGSRYPATFFSSLSYSYRYLSGNSGTCTPPQQPSSVVGDSTNSFCIDTNHIAPLSQYFTDLANGTLPSFAFIEAGYGNSDEHPGSQQSVLAGQAQVAKIINALMTSSSWKDSAFFFSYDEGGGPYDHVPPVPGHSNDFTDASLGTIPDISSIAVNPDPYNPCVPKGGTPTTHCDLESTDPGAQPGDAAAVNGFAAQLGFRLPNFVVSPFARKHFVSHIPMDHTAVIKFVEDRFIGSSAHLTARDAAQPDLLNFFDFNADPWATPPTPPAPVTAQSLGYDPCTPSNFVQ
jgi:phospholipase C